jgi:N-acetyltransferase 10
MGYGSRALRLLVDYYEGKFTSLSEEEGRLVEKTLRRITDEDLANSNPLKDDIKVRDINELPPLFAKLDESRPETLEYVGVSYGLTQQLFKFWNRAEFAPVYLVRATHWFHHLYPPLEIPNGGNAWPLQTLSALPSIC